MIHKKHILTLLCLLGFVKIFAVDKPAQLKRVCLDISDSMAYVYWNTVTDACASFTKYEVYGREDKFSVFNLLKTETNIATNNTSIKLPNRKRWQFFILVSNSCNGLNQFSSDTIFLDNEEPTQWQLDSVSVDIASQKVIAGWSKHDTLDVEGYYIYNVNNGTNSLIGTENGFFFLGISQDPTNAPITHLISAYDSCRNAAPLSSPSTTIHLSKSIDTCLNTLYFSWSHYVGWPLIGKYELYVSINSGPYSKQSIVDENTTKTNFKYTPGDTICAYIRGFNGNNLAITSTSNILCETTKSHIKPDYLYLNKVTIENHTTLKVYSIQDQTKIDSMVLQKRNLNEKWQILDNIKPVPADYSYMDATALINEEEYEYRLLAYNQCKQIIDSSNISKNILLRLQSNNELKWTPYYTFEGGTDKYNIYNSENSSTWNMESFELENNQTEYRYMPLNISSPEGNAYCFCIMGIEQNINKYGRKDTSVSNQVCARGVFNFHVPNAFKPSGLNSVFIPFAQNIEEFDYNMTITNRWGEVFFNSIDPTIGWDGTYNNLPCPMGSYVYVIKAKGKDGTVINTSGIITLIR